VVVDCSRFLRRIVHTGADSVRVQPGVVAAQLEEHLARSGRTLGPDPSNAWVTTVGGMIGRNASGSRFPRHGAVRGRIVALQAVLADGTIADLVPTAMVFAQSSPGVSHTRIEDTPRPALDKSIRAFLLAVDKTVEHLSRTA
jgi:FAD/FMN-containing dehydrogenase